MTHPTMKAKPFPAVAVSLAVMLARFAGNAFVVTGPPGLDAQSYIGVKPVSPLSPMLERMPLKNRLDMSVLFTNRTGQVLVYTGGTVTFRAASGQVILAAPLSPAEFIQRTSLSPSATFAQGLVLIPFGNHTNATLTGLAQPGLDARIVAGGWGYRKSDGKKQCIAARLEADGSFDPSFDGNGLKAAAFGQANAVAVQVDGKILLAGAFGTNILVQRLNADGSEDTSFGPNGTNITSLGASSEAFAVAHDSQGRVVVAGRVASGNVWRLALVRYLVKGSLDATFGANGIVITDVAGSSSETALALAIDGSDRPVVAGWGTVSGHFQMLLARYRTTGVLDTTFSGDGIILTGLSGADDAEARSVGIDGSGRIVAGGAAYLAGVQHFAVARFTSTGAFDAAFNGFGQVITDFPNTGNEGVNGITFAADGVGVFGAGRGADQEAEYFSLARYTSAGALDPQFAGGELSLQITSGDSVAESASANAIVTLPLGDIIVGGTAAFDGDSRWAIARYNPNGTPDTTATVPVNALATLNLTDFPFFTDVRSQGFDGFDPKHTPERLDLELNFNGLAQPFSVKGIELQLVARNARAYRFPLHNPSVAGAQWTVGGGHERGTPHGNTKDQRFHWDVSASLNGSSLIPGVDPADFVGNWVSHPNYSASHTYTAQELPDCRIAWGQPVYACGSGTVVRTNEGYWDNFPVGDLRFGGGGGNSVVIDYGNGEYGFYAHMKKGSVLVTTGQVVIAGTQLGVVGNSGNSAGPHLHFGLVDDPGVTSIANSQARPMYLMNAEFSTSSGDPALRQLGAAPRDGEVLTIDASAIPFASPGTIYGPGLVNEVVPNHDSLSNPQRLVLPVTVVGTVGPQKGTSLADGGDAIEDVYRFSLTQSSSFWVRLDFTSGADLDVLLYDANLLAIQPTAGKTLANPEILSTMLPAGTYYLCVSQYDPTALRSLVFYNLQVGAYPSTRDIYVDNSSNCQYPFGNLACDSANWGGPYPTVKRGDDAIVPPSRMFIHAGTYGEAVTLSKPVVIRSYDGTATINP